MLCVKEYQFTWIGNASKGDCDEVGDDEDDGDDLYIIGAVSQGHFVPLNVTFFI